MALYKNTKKGSPISSVEFSPVSDGNFTFFSVDGPLSVKAVKEWVTDRDVRQEIIAETQVDGHPVLVTHGDKNDQEILKALEKRGEQLTPYHQKKTFTEKVWPMGAAIAATGQVLQLTSSFLRPDRKADWNLRMLAIPNLIASSWIFFYGAQRNKDPHRLTFMKRHFNEELGTHIPGGKDTLPDIHDKRLDLHEDEEFKPKTFGQKLNGVLERNSVTFGEIGLRYMGAASLAFSSNNWKKGLNRVLEGEFKQAYHTTRSPNPITHKAGLLSLAGKTVSIVSKAEDPYNPTPPSTLDKLRETFTFRAGGMMETAAFAALAYDGFANKKISFKKGGAEHADFLSGIGASLFTIRYAMRYWAPFSVRDTNMPELYAHVTDSLAKMPPDKLPQLLADTAADITNNFKDKHLKFGEVFSQLLIDLYKYHHIALDNLGTEPEERAQRLAARSAKTEAGTARPETQSALRNRNIDSPSASHVEKLSQQKPADAVIVRT